MCPGPQTPGLFCPATPNRHISSWNKSRRWCASSAGSSAASTSCGGRCRSLDSPTMIRSAEKRGGTAGDRGRLPDSQQECAAKSRRARSECGRLLRGKRVGRTRRFRRLWVEGYRVSAVASVGDSPIRPTRARIENQPPPHSSGFGIRGRRTRTRHRSRGNSENRTICSCDAPKEKAPGRTRPGSECPRGILCRARGTEDDGAGQRRMDSCGRGKVDAAAGCGHGPKDRTRGCLRNVMRRRLFNFATAVLLCFFWRR